MLGTLEAVQNAVIPPFDTGITAFGSAGTVVFPSKTFVPLTIGSLDGIIQRVFPRKR